MIPYIRKPQQKPQPKREDEGCTIEVKKTKTGKRVKISGRCTREDVKLLTQEGGENA